MTLTILIVVVVVVLAVAFVALTRRSAVAVPFADETVHPIDDGVVSEPVPVNGVVAPADRITWPKQFDPSSGALDDDARLALIEDLGLLRAPWCVPLLEQACREESAPRLHAAAQRALKRCREHRAASPHG